MWNMKVLVTGVNGQVGWELIRRGTKSGFNSMGLDLAELDVSDANAVDKAKHRAQGTG